MDLIIESLRRLYQNEQIDENALNALLKKGTISERDKEYIMRKEGE